MLVSTYAINNKTNTLSDHESMRLIALLEATTTNQVIRKVYSCKSNPFMKSVLNEIRFKIYFKKYFKNYIDECIYYFFGKSKCMIKYHGCEIDIF